MNDLRAGAAPAQHFSSASSPRMIAPSASVICSCPWSPSSWARCSRSPCACSSRGPASVAAARPHAAGGVPLARHHARHPHGLLRADHRAAEWLRQPCSSSTDRRAPHGLALAQRTRLLDRRARPRRPAFRIPASRRRPHLRLDQLSAATAPSPPPGPARARGMDCWLISIGLFCHRLLVQRGQRPRHRPHRALPVG